MSTTTTLSRQEPQAAGLHNPNVSAGLSLWAEAWRRLRKNRVAMGALAYLCLLGLVAFFTPLLPLQSPYQVNTKNALASPVRLEMIDELGAANSVAASPSQSNAINRLLDRARRGIWGNRVISSVCGTDELGRDLLSRLLWASRISLLAGLIAASVSLVIGVSYGAIAVYFGGWVDNLMMRVVDVFYSV